MKNLPIEFLKNICFKYANQGPVTNLEIPRFDGNSGWIFGKHKLSYLKVIVMA